ncbi:hypothetical protein AVO45_03595 [Ruegeria marisrubri]|uniref:PDZ domain-containing protein n=1 Tax=Ruegeria marisrubri TaxID=1685379 RepID=A0A101CZ55_9RHOB|nr:hypothetical protein AVO45_03595 [Ruegeria marisrubri]
MTRGLVRLSSVLVLCTVPLGAQAEDPDCVLSANEIYARASPSVVQVATLSIDLFLVEGRVAMNTGTGFVLEQGYIATNYHVIADSKIIVVFNGGSMIEAAVVGIDPTLDVAVLKVTGGQYFSDAPLEFSNDAQAEIGQQAFAVGFPLGIGKSMSSGIVSGVGRVLRQTTSSWLSPYIQTDAAISPGNSGGPLLNSCGLVIGMITSNISNSGAENIAFAIPTEVLRPVITALVEEGHVSRPWHGLYGQMTAFPILQVLGVPRSAWEEQSGFLIETVEPGSAADRAGLTGGVWPMMWGGAEVLLGGDVITHVNGVRITSMEIAMNSVRGIEIGEIVELKALRNGVPFSVSVEIEERPIMPQELEVYRRARQR